MFEHFRKFDPCFSPLLKVEALPNEKAYRDVRDLVGGNENHLRPTLEEIKAGRRVRLFRNCISFAIFCEMFFHPLCLSFLFHKRHDENSALLNFTLYSRHAQHMSRRCQMWLAAAFGPGQPKFVLAC